MKWWSVVTLTTVGYGDAVPVTEGGKIVGAITMLVGVLVVAFPVTILCNVFQEVYAEYREARFRKLSRAELQARLADNFLLSSTIDERIDLHCSEKLVNSSPPVRLGVPGEKEATSPDQDAGKAAVRPSLQPMKRNTVVRGCTVPSISIEGSEPMGPSAVVQLKMMRSEIDELTTLVKKLLDRQETSVEVCGASAT
ncbi:Potassium voltage-gated channel protein Shal [Diplonema papillatum]|nr:Potassium voltage-gated channel protein Shal [Diplonema papillatum]